jgi:DNA-binding transcriptional LysR family regulator
VQKPVAAGVPRRSVRMSRPPPLPSLELNAVRALVALLTEKSVSRAAETLGQSQPQMSATLRRMRSLLRDPILVRGSHGMVPTDHALALLEPAQRILSDMQTLLAEPQRFDPLTMRRSLRLAVPDFLSAALLGSILGELRTRAPESSILVRAVRSDSHGVELLESGQADVLIESNLIRSSTIRYATLFDDTVLAVATRSHPLAREGMSLETYLQLPHVAAAPASGTRPGMIDRMLAERGYTRRVVAWMPYLNTLPQVLANSDLVFTTTAHMARHFSRQAELQAFSPPIRFPRIRYFLMWHDRVHRSGEHRWLRNLIHGAVPAGLAG